MPVQTRRKVGGAAAKSEAKSSETSAATTPKKSRSRAPSPAKKPAQKKAKADKSATYSSVDGEKKQFEPVVEQINTLGTHIKSSVLKTHVPTISRKQDPYKLAKRQVVALELRRVSMDAEESVNPSDVLKKAKEYKGRKETATKAIHKNVVKQIEDLGEQKIKDVLKARKGGVKKVKKAKGAVRPVVVEDVKKVQKQTIQELTTLVTPTAAHYPSVIKSKVSLKKAKKTVNAEVLKKVSVKHIHRLSEKGVQALINDKSKEVAAVKPVTAVNEKKAKAKK